MSENEEQGVKTSDLMAYRKKRKRKMLYVRLGIAILILGAVVIIASNFSAIVEPLRGIASRIETKTSDDVGFPIKLPGSASYSFDSFGDNFLLLTDTYLYTFGTNGGQNYALRHGYSNPTQCSNSKRILLYDKDYNDFSLYSKTSTIYSNRVDEKIVFASIGSNEAAAIVTNSDRYSNIIYIYDGNGEWKYTRKFIDENVMNVEFSNDERNIYVCTISVENGEIFSTIYKYDITSESEAIWKYKVLKSSIPVKMNVQNGKVCVIYDNYAISINDNDGSLAGNKEFQGTIQCCDFSDSFMGIIYVDSAANKKVLTVINDNMTSSYARVVTPNIDRIIADGNNFFIVETGILNGYNSNAEPIIEKKLRDEYVSFVKIGNSVLFLGYDSVDVEYIS